MCQRRVLGRGRQPQMHGELELGGVAGCHALRARQRQHVAKRAPRQFEVDLNVEIAKSPEDFDSACLGAASALLGAEKDVADLQCPRGRNVRPRGAPTIKKRPRLGCAFVIDARRERHRCVEHEAAQRRPSSRSVLHDRRPSVCCRAKALARATGSPSALRRRVLAGTWRATGMPHRVIITSVPQATSSSDVLKCVLASNVPISFVRVPQAGLLTRSVYRASHSPSRRILMGWLLRADSVIK